MSKDIKIEYKQYRLPYKIVIDGVTYPNNQRNWDVVAEYNQTQDENVLDKLVIFSFTFDPMDIEDRNDDSAKDEVEID